MTCRRKLTDIMCSRCDGDVVLVTLFRERALSKVYALITVIAYINSAAKICLPLMQITSSEFAEKMI